LYPAVGEPAISAAAEEAVTNTHGAHTTPSRDADSIT
jgi:hypothetical protein